MEDLVAARCGVTARAAAHGRGIGVGAVRARRVHIGGAGQPGRGRRAAPPSPCRPRRTTSATSTATDASTPPPPRPCSTKTGSSWTSSSTSSIRTATPAASAAASPRRTAGRTPACASRRTCSSTWCSVRATPRSGCCPGLPFAGRDSPLAIDIMERARVRLAELGPDQRLLLQAPVFPATGPLQAALDGMAADAAHLSRGGLEDLHPHARTSTGSTTSGATRC